MWNRKLWLCLPATVLCLIDHSLTMWFQPAEYWNGSYMAAQEMNPQFLWLLQQHPLAGEAGLVGYVLVFCGLIVALPWRLALVASLALTLGHTWGAGTWIGYHVIPHGYWLTICLCVFSAILVVIALEQAGLIRYDSRPGSEEMDFDEPT
jgi:hypothetical protein